MQRDLFDKTKNEETSIYVLSCRKDIDDFIVSKISGNEKVLEIGCSTGGLLVKIFNKIKTPVYGLDISRESINLIVDKTNIIATVNNLDEENLPYKNENFDLVVSSHTIEHIIDTHKFMEESRRVLKKDGRLIICCPNINNPVSWFMQVFMDLTPKNASRPYSAHYRDFSLRILLQICKMHGFKVIESHGIGIYPFNNLATKLILKIFPRFGENILVECVKVERNLVPKNIYEDIREFIT